MQLPEACRIDGKSDAEALAVWGLVGLAILVVLALLLALVTNGAYSPPEF